MPPGKPLTLMCLLCVGMVASLTQCAVAPEPKSPAEQIPSEPPQPVFTTQNWPNDDAPRAYVYVVTIPPGYSVEVAVSEELKTVEDFAADTGALAVLNGGFFDPSNGQTTSFVKVNGALVADPRENRRLMDNPDLVPYIGQILNRSEFRRYDCRDRIRYDITFHNESVPDGCTLQSALGAGPQLLPNDTSQAEGFTDYVDDVLIRDAIGSQQRNARSAIGIKSDGTLVWLMVAQTDPANGMTLAELAEFMTTLDIYKALNLDGGSSSSLYAAGVASDSQPQTYYGRLNQSGQSIQRPVKSVLFISEP